MFEIFSLIYFQIESDNKKRGTKDDEESEKNAIKKCQSNEWLKKYQNK